MRRSNVHFFAAIDFVRSLALFRIIIGASFLFSQHHVIRVPYHSCAYRGYSLSHLCPSFPPHMAQRCPCSMYRTVVVELLYEALGRARHARERRGDQDARNGLTCMRTTRGHQTRRSRMHSAPQSYRDQLTWRSKSTHEYEQMTGADDARVPRFLR